MIELYEHNQKTYENLKKLFVDHNRIACVQPTGTGKSFIILKLIEDNPDKKFIITSPSVYIFEQIKTHAEKNTVNIINCQFFTYQKILYMNNENVRKLEADYIITDEFHRLGSAEWGEKCIQYLLSTHKNSKVLGTSATPIRYLDCMRDMAEEIFDGCYAVNMNLAEAIRQHILPLPVYITAWYSFSGELAEIEKKVYNTENQYLKKKVCASIQKVRSRLINTECGMEKVLEKHIENRNGKYIIFCPNVESLENAKDECDSWFRYVNGNIRVYSVYAYGDDARSQFESFRNDVSENTLKLLLCIDMLNEGIHIDGIDGVIMLRATKSANVFYQQLGRALSCSKSRPVIFDLVNNYETGDTAEEYRNIMELGKKYACGEDESGISFEIYDYVKDIRTLLDEIYTTFENSWDLTFELLENFLSENNRFPYFGESYNGCSIGSWCTNQRVLYNKNKLSEGKIKKLENIGFIWDKNEECWNRNFILLKEFYESNGRFPKRNDSFRNEELKILYSWSLTQRNMFAQGKLSESRTYKLQSIGFDLIIHSDDEIWEERYRLIKDFYLKNGRLPLKSEMNAGKINVPYSWLITQRKYKKEMKLSKEKIEKLDEIGFIWDIDEERWNSKFEALKKFVDEKKRVPKAVEKYCGFDIGQWYTAQVKYLNSGKLQIDRVNKILSLNASHVSDSKRKWTVMYEKLKEFINKNNRFPYSGEVYEGADLYRWINKQKIKLKNGKLDNEYLSKFESLNLDLLHFTSNKKDSVTPQRWLDIFSEYRDFVAENSRPPKRGIESEGKLYRWRKRQVQYLENGKLNEEQKNMLECIHFE